MVKKIEKKNSLKVESKIKIIKNHSEESMTSVVASVIDVASAIEDERKQNVYVNNQYFVSEESIDELAKKKIIITRDNELNIERIRGEDRANVMIYFTGFIRDQRVEATIGEMIKKIPRTIRTLIIDNFAISNNWKCIPEHIENVIVYQHCFTEGEYEVEIIKHKMQYLKFSYDDVFNSLFSECFEECKRNPRIMADFTPYLMKYGKIEQVEEVFDMIDVSNMYMGDVNLLNVFIARKIDIIKNEHYYRDGTSHQEEKVKINRVLEKFVDKMTNEQLIEVRKIECWDHDFINLYGKLENSIFLNMCWYFSTDERFIMKVIDRLTSEQLKRIQDTEFVWETVSVVEMLQERGFGNARAQMMEKLGMVSVKRETVEETTADEKRSRTE